MAERVPGFVFLPTDEQLIKEYLAKKENGLPLPGQAVVELDLYCEKSPWEVLNRNDLPWQIFKTRDRKTRNIKYESTVYVLTPLKKTSQKAQSRIRRTAGCGKWLEQWAQENLNDNDDVIGFKKMLAFLVVDNSVFDGADEGLIKRHWIMHEYTLKSENFPFALCKITRDASKNLKGAPNNARKRKAAVVEEEEVNNWEKKGKHDCQEKGKAAVVGIVPGSSEGMNYCAIYDPLLQLTLVPGYVFLPTDEQLIKDYLEKKENGLPLPGQAVVELDLYCEKSPWEVLNRNDLPWQIFKTRDRKTRNIKYESTIYVLTPLKKTSQKAQSRIRRTAGCGKWQEYWAQKILNDNDDVIGFKKMLAFLVVDNSVFDGADGDLIKGHWIMHEYTLKSEKFPFALCKITRDASKNLKGPNNARKKKADVVVEEEVNNWEKKGKHDCHEKGKAAVVGIVPGSSEGMNYCTIYDPLPQLTLEDGLWYDSYYEQ